MRRRLLPDRHGGPVSATINLVAPLAYKATAMRTMDTAGNPHSRPERSSAVPPLIGFGLRRGDVDSVNHRSTPATATTPGARTSTTATRTTGTRTTTTWCARFADEAVSCRAEFSFEDLVVAYVDCRQHKRNTEAALTFEENLEQNLADLYEELHEDTYQPGVSICFVVTRPKAREVWAADFRDRIVHHLLYNRIAPLFYRSFIPDSCACIPGRGTLYAAERLEHKVRSVTQNWSRSARYLKCDIANFFVSIDKRILHGFLRARVKEPWWLRLAETILFHDPRENVVLRSTPKRLALIPSYKSLFTQDANHGLPIGNLSSQFFANVYLDALDQHVKHRIRALHYVRYVDDFVLLHESAQWLNAAHDEIARFLEVALALRLNNSKTVRQPIARGIDFVGQVVKPWRRTIRRRTSNDALSRITRIQSGDLFETANSYFGLLRQATHSHHIRARLAKILLRRGHTVNWHFTKTYRTQKVNSCSF